MAQGFKMRKLVTNTKPFFCESEANVETFPGSSTYISTYITMFPRSSTYITISVYLSFRYNGFQDCQKRESNLIMLEIMAQGFKMQKMVDKYKIVFHGKRDKC